MRRMWEKAVRLNEHVAGVRAFWENVAFLVVFFGAAAALYTLALSSTGVTNEQIVRALIFLLLGAIAVGSIVLFLMRIAAIWFVGPKSRTGQIIGRLGEKIEKLDSDIEILTGSSSNFGVQVSQTEEQLRAVSLDLDELQSTQRKLAGSVSREVAAGISAVTALYLVVREGADRKDSLRLLLELGKLQQVRISEASLAKPQPINENSVKSPGDLLFHSLQSDDQLISFAKLFRELVPDTPLNLPAVAHEPFWRSSISIALAPGDERFWASVDEKVAWMAKLGALSNSAGWIEEALNTLSSLIVSDDVSDASG